MLAFDNPLYTKPGVIMKLGDAPPKPVAELPDLTTKWRKSPPRQGSTKEEFGSCASITQRARNG